MSEVSFIKELDQSVGDVPLVGFQWSEIFYENGLEVLRDGSEVSITHDSVQELLEIIIADLFEGAMDHEMPSFDWF